MSQPINPASARSFVLGIYDADLGQLVRVSLPVELMSPLGNRILREMLAGHLCRCTGYHFIVEAIAEAARALSGSGPAVSPDGAKRMGS